MPNIEGLGLQNFRTFKSQENLEFASITLITGTNNAGKSSVFKALQFLVHNFKDGIVSETLDFKTMKHELGNLDRILNRTTMGVFKNLKNPGSKEMYIRLSDYKSKIDSCPGELPIFEEDEDLVFAFPIKFGGNRKISASLEIRYELKQVIRRNGDKDVVEVSHNIKSIAIVKNEEYIHWTNIIDQLKYHDDAPRWEMMTSIDLKKIVQLILDTQLIKEDNFSPNEKTEEYFTLDLFSRIERFKRTYFELPFFQNKKDNYQDFIEKFIQGESLFSDYSEITKEKRIKLLKIEQEIISQYLQGKDNSQYKILDCFENSFTDLFYGMGQNIAKAELEKESTVEKHGNDEDENVNAFFNSLNIQTTSNSELFSSLIRAIEKDFLYSVQQKIDSLKRVYFLTTSRGRNREWFIDEQNNEDIQIVREFSEIYLDSHPQIKQFVTFWIGKGEIEDKNGNKKQKGFKIGKELFVYRDETIGLTKVFVVDFDDTKIPLVDLGYGVSQILPIIMKIAIIAQKHQETYEYNEYEGDFQSQTIFFKPSTLLIEEPEANLHPSLQSKMAELFIDAGSRFNIQFLIETHSEYLIYKFQEYIGLNILSTEDVKMYYFNHPNDVKEGLRCKYISHVQIDKDGSIDYEEYFGKGFFDEQNNLKLSLLNIQRDHFIKDYDVIKAKLKESNDTLDILDSKIEELDQNLKSANSGRNRLQEELVEIKKEKEIKEVELQRQIEEQEGIIDEYTSKTDYEAYFSEIDDIIDTNKIDSVKTLQYLQTGKYLIKNLSNSADFAPVIIQYGRAVEFELIKWFSNFKDSINASDKISWSLPANYRDCLSTVFSNVDRIRTDSDLIFVEIEANVEIKINSSHLKGYTSSNVEKYTFGNLTQIFELLHYISPEVNSNFNYSSVPLVAAFSDYLKDIFTDYSSAERLFNSFRKILDLRNCASHTYNNTICSSDIIDKSTAEDYIATVENIFKYL